jgi:hypothetical protein
VSSNWAELIAFRVSKTLGELHVLHAPKKCLKIGFKTIERRDYVYFFYIVFYSGMDASHPEILILDTQS